VSKDATFNIQTLAAYMRELGGDNCDVTLCAESMWLSARVLGYQAYVPGLGNAFPESCVRMWLAGMQNDFEACRKTQFLVNEIREHMCTARSTELAICAMASLRGIVDAHFRAPFLPATEEERAALQTAFDKSGVLDVPVHN
jgi:dihydrodipicolinate synthase/N-acetylneuraminate lyase